MKNELTIEQQKIVDRWEAEREARGLLIDKLEADQSAEVFQAVLQELYDLSPTHCEHGRAVINTCMACDEIERIIHPELFEEEEE